MKQYLMLCDDSGMELFKKLFSTTTIQFLEVQGMSIQGNPNVNIMVTPVVPPITPMQVPQLVSPPDEPPTMD